MWNGDQCRGALPFRRANHVSGIWSRLKNDGSAQQRRNEQRHKLPEHMSEGNKRHKAQGMKPSLVLAVRSHSTLERLEISQKISVGQNDAARLSSSARGEENLRDMVASDGLIGNGRVRRR